MGKHQVLAAVARRQHGVFTRRQALDAGFSSSAIQRLTATGVWIVMHRGVFCDAKSLPSFERDASAAVLACGASAAASHSTAAKLWSVDVPAAPRPEVTVCQPRRARPNGVIVHRTDRLLPSEAAPRNGIRITSPMRTLVDVATVIESRLLELALDQLWRRKLVHPAHLLAYLDEAWCRGRRGTGPLRTMVRERLGQRPSGSDLETMLLQLIRAAGLPLPVRQFPVATWAGTRYIDLAYPNRRIAIETDGMESRLDPDVFIDERTRQNLISQQGWSFRRFGYAQVTREPLWTVFSIGEALGLRPVKWATARMAGPDALRRAACTK